MRNGMAAFTQWKLSLCKNSSRMCVFERVWLNCNMTYPRKTCAQKVEVEEMTCPSQAANQMATSKASSKFQIPRYELRELLPLVAKNNHVVLTGMNFGYRDMLMSFVCNLRRLGLHKGFIIGAFDEAIYEFAWKMGLPVFLATSNPFGQNPTEASDFGTQKLALSSLPLGSFIII